MDHGGKKLMSERDAQRQKSADDSDGADNIINSPTASLVRKLSGTSFRVLSHGGQQAEKVIIMGEYNVLRNERQLHYIQAVMCVIAQRVPGERLTDHFLDVVILPFTAEDRTRPLRPGGSNDAECTRYLLWWAHRGVHPVHIVHRLRSKPGAAPVAYRLLGLVVQSAPAFKVAIPSMDDSTLRLTRQLQSASGISCRELVLHHQANLARPVHHIDHDYRYVRNPSAFMHKDNAIYLVRATQFPAYTITVQHFAQQRAVINVNRSRVWLKPGVDSPQYCYAQWSSENQALTTTDWSLELNIVKCLADDTREESTACLKEDGHLYLNDKRMPGNHAPYVDFVYANTLEDRSTFFALSAVGNIYFIQCPGIIDYEADFVATTSSDDSLHENQFRIIPVYSSPRHNDPVIQIVSNYTAFGFKVVTLHASGCVREHSYSYGIPPTMTDLAHGRVVTLIPKGFRWHIVTTDAGDYIAKRLVCIVEHNKLFVLEIKTTRRQHRAPRFVQIRSMDDNNEIDLGLVIEMVQTISDHVFFLLATGAVYDCVINYTTREYTCVEVHIAEEMVVTTDYEETEAEDYRSRLTLRF